MDKGEAECTGLVRYGNLESETWSSEFPINGKYECSSKNFGDPARFKDKECQCKADNQAYFNTS